MIKQLQEMANFKNFRKGKQKTNMSLTLTNDFFLPVENAIKQKCEYYVALNPSEKIDYIMFAFRELLNKENKNERQESNI